MNKIKFYFDKNNFRKKNLLAFKSHINNKLIVPHTNLTYIKNKNNFCSAQMARYVT